MCPLRIQRVVNVVYDAVSPGIRFSTVRYDKRIRLPVTDANIWPKSIGPTGVVRTSGEIRHDTGKRGARNGGIELVV